MIIGVDFDNTIVCYDRVFHQAALAAGLIPPGLAVNKTAVRDHLRRIGNEAAWTALQGEVYGPRMREAEAFAGVKEFFRKCRAREVAVRIISHKTRFPYAGQRHDLHAAALDWLEQQGFFAADGIGLARENVFFELTKQAKLARIAQAGCETFIDDLPELLAEPEFPQAAQKILFDPGQCHAAADGVRRVASWAEISAVLWGPSEFAPNVDGILRQLGRRAARPPTRIAGGGNNRLFEVRDEHGERYVLKQYFQGASEPRSRFESERLFYRLAAVAAPGRTPRALAWDPPGQLGLLTFVDGRRLQPDEIGAAAVDAALAFFQLLNAQRHTPEARALPLAAEACFTSEEHLATVDRRVERLAHIARDEAIDGEACAFVEAELRPAWRALREGFPVSGQVLPERERCVSPSDFGFHNALVGSDGALVFFDFEYAGWDDPAKCVCDFFCQPAVPVAGRFFLRFVEQIADVLALRDVAAFRARCETLLPLYRLKWSCIALNEFIGADRARRAFARGDAAVAARKAEQLALARRFLAAARHPLHGTPA